MFLTLKEIEDIRNTAESASKTIDILNNMIKIKDECIEELELQIIKLKSENQHLNRKIDHGCINQPCSLCD